MRLFDSHCHLDDASYDRDRAAVLGRARAAGVAAMMVVGIDIPRSRKALSLAEAHSGIFAAVGVHPHDASQCSETVLADTKEWDSLGVVEFQSLVDEELEIQVPPPQITACQKVQELIDLVAEKLEG